ncbi:unnamed protein product [Arabidopsis thaliana]|uniref:Glycine-rich protein n=1 Tax=Arabidopsis thaliana TaxID=3702 RepID=A0A5S9XSU7_ARATH|nr:unnamed protein product [Arabidopsis thaliana]
MMPDKFSDILNKRFSLKDLGIDQVTRADAEIDLGKPSEREAFDYDTGYGTVGSVGGGLTMTGIGVSGGGLTVIGVGVSGGGRGLKKPGGGGGGGGATSGGGSNSGVGGRGRLTGTCFGVTRIGLGRKAFGEGLKGKTFGKGLKVKTFGKGFKKPMR